MQLPQTPDNSTRDAHAAYAGVVLVWATTPLAIRWSNDTWSPTSALTARMLLALLILGSTWLLALRRLPLSRGHVRIYAAAALGLFPNMLFVYHAAQYIPSGLVSVLFGMSPIFIGLLSALWLGQHEFDPRRILATLIALAGLCTVFAGQMKIDDNSWPGIALMLASNLCFAASSVLVKRERLQVGAWEKTLGSLLCATPLFIGYWLVVDARLPATTSLKSDLAIIYLAVIGSLGGMWCFFKVLNSFSVDRVALIPLMTPVLATLLGHVLAHEPLHASLLAGSAAIVLGLALYDPILLARWTRRLQVRS